MALSSRSARHRAGAGLALPPRTPQDAGAGGRWCLAARGRALRLSADMIGDDVADLGVQVPAMRLRRVLLGVEPAEPTLLCALVEVLQLRDRSLSDEQVVAATAGAWLAVGRRVPPAVVTTLAEARTMPAQQVLNLATRTRPRSLPR